MPLFLHSVIIVNLLHLNKDGITNIMNYTLAQLLLILSGSDLNCCSPCNLLCLKRWLVRNCEQCTFRTFVHTNAQCDYYSKWILNTKLFFYLTNIYWHSSCWYMSPYRSCLNSSINTVYTVRRTLASSFMIYLIYKVHSE